MANKIFPPYFEKISQNASQIWEKLEADEQIAAPWWQLFKQIQSPRHVLSELLQNADDAGARSAEVRIEEGTFIFEHDGEDFNEDQFASLCRFGFSNKRNLHTIGFRGIGFKSTFSLGDIVDLLTPSISVRYYSRRFTEPVWINNAPSTPRTRISIRLRDEHVLQEIQKSLEEWANSRLSLLFFQNVGSLTISGKEITRTVIGEGPVKGSERIRLSSGDEKEIIHITSPLEEFPAEAIEEIQRERMAGDQEFSLPPCKVEIVVGVPGPQNLYVVLPTDKETRMPFSVNAPFVQDPARMGIKDPSISPTNRWLLERVGRLVAESMSEWLGNEQCDLSERAEAYRLLPAHREWVNGCDVIICSVISEYLERSPILLASDGSLVKTCFVPPYPLYEIWDPENIAIFAGKDYTAILSRTIRSDYRERLEKWGLLAINNDSEIVEWFKTHTVPRPAEDDQIVLLWAYVIRYYRGYYPDKLDIIPVGGLDRLYPPNRVVRVGDSIRGLSEDDTEFLSNYLHFIDQSFIRKVTEQLKNPKADNNWAISEVLSREKLEKDSSEKVLIERAYDGLLKDRKNLIRFALVTGFLNTDVPKGFFYVTQDGRIHQVEDDLALDPQGYLAEILPEDYRTSHILHEDYLAGLDPDKRRKWIGWAQSTKSGLKSFVGIEEKSKTIYGKTRFLESLKALGGREPGEKEYPIQRKVFIFTDYDFRPDVLDQIERFCESLSEDKKPLAWFKILDLIASDPMRSWKNQLHATFSQQGRSHDHPLPCGNLPASWIRRLAKIRCLQDTDDIPREPHELLMRNVQTEALMGVEPFVRHEYDTKELHDLLLALGVRNTPGSPNSVLDRIKIFSGHDDPPEYELIKLYERLDRLLKYCTPDEVGHVQRYFGEHRMIFTRERTWAYPHEVFRTIPCAEMPGIFVVLPALRDLPLWSRIGVAHEPTIDILIGQLDNLESGSSVEAADRNRIRMILSRAPHRVWNETGHWLSLDAIWKPVSAFSYFLSKNLAGGVDALFPQVKGITADMRMVDNQDITTLISASELKDLQSALSLRVSNLVEDGPSEGDRPWMTTLGKLLKRVTYENTDEEQEIQGMGVRLSETVWKPVSDIRVMPYLCGSPAGREQTPEVFWDDRVLYLCKLSPGRLLRVVPTELRKACSVQAVADAIVYCYDRDPVIVSEYCEANFTLLPEAREPLISQPPVPAGGKTALDPQEGILHLAPVQSANSGCFSAETEEQEVTLEPELQTAPIADKHPSHTPSLATGGGDRPQRCSLIEIFAEQYHYQRAQSNGHFTHSDGSWIQRCDGPFQWEILSSDGNVLGRLWIEDGILRRGIEMPAEVWGMIEKDPKKSAVLFRAEDDGVDVISGTALLTGIKHKDLDLLLAKYRLRRINE
ncbi:ATP-binding protein [Methanofollis aquaemaris]|uniref:ATP-binding protein n=1 Tax=Methanofollis aquaemaris TaxID=126734 RepID=A0A8A3S328_9EURY|nr:hypothetical protein [Methanofollis aquaemaris]QSZ66151.1 ATP-binding protein [Methanofollis aquaemaris]